MLYTWHSVIGSLSKTGHIGSVYYSHRVGDVKNVNVIDRRRSKIIRNRVFDCHLSPDWRQMAIESTVSSVFYWCSSIVKSVFHCRLPDVLMAEGSIMVNENETTIKGHQFQSSDTSRHRQTDIITLKHPSNKK